MTTKEINLLNEIKNHTSKDESNYSGFLSTNALSKSNAGIISSLEKKGFIYKSYEGMTKEDFIEMTGIKTKPFKMWCVTPKGWELETDASDAYMNLVKQAIKGYRNRNYKY